MGDLNKKGTENQVKGMAKEMTGKVKGNVGDALDNSRMHAEGRGEELKGKIQKTAGKAERAVDPDNHRDAAKSGDMDASRRS
jgi:uncharacterized protein YjbJ (UPF0337 family)